MRRPILSGARSAGRAETNEAPTPTPDGPIRAIHELVTIHELLRTPSCCAVFVSIATAAPFAAGIAQARTAPDTSTALRLGDTVQVRARNPTSPLGIETTCVGAVGALRPDTIYVTRSNACGPRHIERVDLKSLRVARGSAGSRLDHLAKGMLIGGMVTGVASAAIVAGSPCSVCDDDYPLVFAAALGGAVGVLAGGLLGLALPAGPRWLNVSDPPAIRIAGYTLRPGLQIVSGPTARSENRER